MEPNLEESNVGDTERIQEQNSFNLMNLKLTPTSITNSLETISGLLGK